MAWIQETPSKGTWLQRMCASVLKAGPIPRHLAFIMDGNRRFARKNSMDRAQGHLEGFNKLAETLNWCLNLGITEVTVYAFSIENFKRSKEEVDALMEIARQKFNRLLQEREIIEKHGVCVRVLGNISLLPRDIQEIIAEAVDISKHNTKAILNVCFSYTSRDEICFAMREVAEGVKTGLILESDINEHLLEQCLYTSDSRPPDLLIRTSGEVRLSDFLLWQSSFSALSFVKVLWPEFTIWHLFGAILHYQYNYDAIKQAKEEHACEQEELDRANDYEQVMKETEAGGQGSDTGDTCSMSSLRDQVSAYRHAREQRTDNFLQHVRCKRTQYLQSLLSCKAR